MSQVPAEYTLVPEETHDGHQVYTKDGKKYYFVEETKIRDRTSSRPINGVQLEGYMIAKYHNRMDVLSSLDSMNSEVFDIQPYECKQYIKDPEGIYTMDPVMPRVPDAEIARLNLPKSIDAYFQHDDGREVRFQMEYNEIYYYNVRIENELHMTEEDVGYGTLRADFIGYLWDMETTAWQEEYQVQVVQGPISTSLEEHVQTRQVEGPTYCELLKDWFYSWRLRLPSYDGVIGTSSCLGSIIQLLSFMFLMGIILLFLSTGVRTCSPPSQGTYPITGSGGWTDDQPPYDPTLDPDYQPWSDSLDQQRSSDSLVDEDGRVVSDTLWKYRIWYDYRGHMQKGYYWVLRSDVARSHSFKSNLTNTNSTIRGYGEAVSKISALDDSRLAGVYALFDHLRSTQKMTPKTFAEMIGCFVQDIDYAVVNQGSCSSSQSDFDCVEYQKYGILTPVESIAIDISDCDSKTILLYTILDHYGYDVAFLTSDAYSHAMLGIALPGYTGSSVSRYGKSYYFWELTSKDAIPGMISPTTANPNFWNITLTSK